MRQHERLSLANIGDFTLKNLATLIVLKLLEYCECVTRGLVARKDVDKERVKTAVDKI